MLPTIRGHNTESVDIAENNDVPSFFVIVLVPGAVSIVMVSPAVNVVSRYIISPDVRFLIYIADPGPVIAQRGHVCTSPVLLIVAEPNTDDDVKIRGNNGKKVDVVAA